MYELFQPVIYTCRVLFIHCLFAFFLRGIIVVLNNKTHNVPQIAASFIFKRSFQCVQSALHYTLRYNICKDCASIWSGHCFS